MAKLTTEDIVDALKEMTVLEVSELVKTLEETFGINASAMQFAAAPASAGSSSPTEQAAEEKTKFDLVLADSGAQKIGVIKVIRTIVPELTLKDAKDLVDAAPKTVKEGMTKEDAEKAKAELEKAGAKAEIK